MDSIGERLLYLREQTRLNRQQVMVRANISNLGRYESNERSPNIETLAALANFYNVSIDWIVTGKSGGQQGDGSPPWKLNDRQKEVAEKQFEMLTEEQVALINTYEKLSPKEKEEIWFLMEFKIQRKPGLSSNSQTSKDEESGSSKTA